MSEALVSVPWTVTQGPPANSLAWSYPWCARMVHCATSLIHSVVCWLWVTVWLYGQSIFYFWFLKILTEFSTLIWRHILFIWNTSFSLDMLYTVTIFLNNVKNNNKNLRRYTKDHQSNQLSLLQIGLRKNLRLIFFWQNILKPEIIFWNEFFISLLPGELSKEVKSSSQGRQLSNHMESFHVQTVALQAF